MNEKIFIQFSEINNYIEQINNCASLEEYTETFQTQIENLGFNTFTYWMIRPVEGERQPFYISTFRKDYSAYYVANDLKNVDPIWSKTANRITPYSWNEVLKVKLKEDQEKYRLVFNVGREFGIRSGGTIPLHGPGNFKGGVTIACSDEQDFVDERFNYYQGYLQILANYLHEKLVIYTINNKQDGYKSTLTFKEKEVLLWAANGKTNWEIGQILSVSENTVKSHWQSIFTKLGVMNKIHATVRAIMLGEVTP